MNKEIEICYLCGLDLSGDIDRDHVPPKQFYAKEIREKHVLNLLTLPVHSACNKSYQKDEDYFVNSIGPLAKESYSGKCIWKDITQQVGRPQGFRLAQKIYNEFDVRPSGLYLPVGKVVKRFDPNRVWRVVWKIVRGLFFKEHGRFLPKNTLRNYHKIISVGEKPPSIFAAVRDTPSRGQYPGVFDYKYIVEPKLDNFNLWAMLFWDELIIMIGFHDPECQCNLCNNMREEG